MSSTAEQVRDAAAALVEAFGHHRRDEYFSCFHPDATFVFYNNSGRLDDREAYRRLWLTWEADGFQVLGCTSHEGRVQLLGADTAVFTHRVRTRLAGENTVQAERETIVFTREDDGTWLAVHEHLSADPDTGELDTSELGTSNVSMGASLGHDAISDEQRRD